MAKIERKCDCCNKPYQADTRNLKRGWGKCCTKSCAAKLRERSRHDYNPLRVAFNNRWRAGKSVSYTDLLKFGTAAQIESYRQFASNFDVDLDGTIQGYTSEGYRVVGGIAYNEYDEPEYTVDSLAGDYDPGDSMYWDSKDF